MTRSNAIASLRDRLAALPHARPDAGAKAVVPTPLGICLRIGALHEWIGCSGTRRCDWSPPRCLLADLAVRAVTACSISHVVWIGRRCWPWPVHLACTNTVVDRSCFIDPPDAASAIWAMDVALRSPSPVMVIADGHGLAMPHSRRLQLVASEHGSICVLSRPPSDESELSTACTRWRVEPSIADSLCPRWVVTLVRNKDNGALSNQRPSWVVEWNDATGAVHLSAAVAGRAGGSAGSEAGRRRFGSGAA